MIASAKPDRPRVVRRLLVVALSLAAVLASSAARADETLPARNRLVYQALLGGRVNALGAVLRGNLGWRLRLYDRRSMLLDGSFVGVDLIPTLSPSWYEVGASVIVKPLAVLELSATYEHIGYLGTWNEMQSFAGPGADYSPAARDARGQQGLNYLGQGNRLTVSVLLQAKVGPIAARNQIRFIHLDMALRGGDTVFYDSQLDMLDPGQGWAWVDDADLVWVGHKNLVAGIRYTETTTLYAGGGAQASHRVGPIVTYTLPGHEHGLLQKPTGILMLQWWVSSPYRSGQKVSALIPCLTIAVRVNGDLL